MQTYLFLLTCEIPNPPTHVLQTVTPLLRIPHRHDLDPCLVQVSLVEAVDYFLDEVLCGTEGESRYEGHHVGR